MQNPFVWHDLMTTDVEGAKAFYQKVIGWHFSSQGPGYHVTLVGEHGVGGIMEIPEHLKGMPPFWYGYVYTPDVDAACKQVIECGGKVLRQPWDIEETIRMAVIADPDGAVVNIMQPLSKERAYMAGRRRSRNCWLERVACWQSRCGVGLLFQNVWLDQRTRSRHGRASGHLSALSNQRQRRRRHDEEDGYDAASRVALLFHGRRNRRGRAACPRCRRHNRDGTA